jgi:NaMN:DMB phosphoribosyltransferase
MPPFTYEGLLSLLICSYTAYSIYTHGYAAHGHVLVLVQAVICNIALSPLFDMRKSVFTGLHRLRYATNVLYTWSRRTNY